MIVNLLIIVSIVSVVLLTVTVAVLSYLLRRKNRLGDYVERGLIAGVSIVEQYAQTQKTRRDHEASELQKLFPMK